MPVEWYSRCSSSRGLAPVVFRFSAAFIHATPHIPNAYNDPNRGYSHDTSSGSESRLDDNSLNASLDDSAISYIAEPSDGSDCVNNLCNDAITIISEPNVGSDCLASLDNDAPTIMAEPSDGLDCVISLDNDGIAEPSDDSDCVASLDNDIIENIAELSDCSDYITSESEIALSPKTESQIGHVDVRKDNDNVLRDSSEIESKIVMHTYQRPYPEHVDSVPYPQGFEVPNFTKFTAEDARTKMEHIGQFIDQCGKVGSNDLLKLKLFPLSLSNFASTWYSLLSPNSISTWSQMEHEFHGYFKDASLMEQRPIDTLSVTCKTNSVTSMPKTGIVSDPLPVSPIDVDKKKGKSVIIGDPRPETIRINNAKAEDHKVAKDQPSSSQKTKKPKLTFEMLMAKYKKGLASQRFDNQTSDSKRPRSSRRKRFGQTSKQSEPSTIPTPYKPPVVMPSCPYPMSLYGYPFMYYMPWMPQPPMPCHQEWKQSPRTVPSHSNSRQDRFPRKNRSGRSKVKNVKKVWVRKEAKAPEVIAIKEKSQDVQVPIENAVKTIQAEKTEADAVAVDIGGLTKPVGRGRSDWGALEKSGRIESNIGASTSTKNIKNHCLAPGKQPQPKWIPSGLSRSQKRRLQRLRAIGQKEKKAEDVENKTCNNLEPRTTSRQVWRPKECGIHLTFEIVQSRKPILLGGQDINMLMKKSREMNGVGYNITSLSRRLLDAKARITDQGRSDRHCMASLTGGSLWSDRLCITGLIGQIGRSDRHCVPFRGWALDFIGQIYPSSKGYWFVLVAMDYFTKWAEAVSLENITCTEANG
uniref:Retrotransposon protein, putative, Ty3-gypsy subclass n=1 Tax=Oryza sativa subsp. japonica TaxID=39947 RepID=Q2QPN6_ORYSJ|nr:retrotransposon protein, putative, Ty3-gypsy subclass [Oryza sativa Japonica Group]